MQNQREWIDDILSKKNWTRRMLAEKMGVSLRTVESWFAREDALNYRALNAMAINLLVRLEKS